MKPIAEKQGGYIGVLSRNFSPLGIEGEAREWLTNTKVGKVNLLRKLTRDEASMIIEAILNYQESDDENYLKAIIEKMKEVFERSGSGTPLTA